jgi:broad specificity phosphatase PhoE
MAIITLASSCNSTSSSPMPICDPICHKKVFVLRHGFSRSNGLKGFYSNRVEDLNHVASDLTYEGMEKIFNIANIFFSAFKPSKVTVMTSTLERTKETTLIFREVGSLLGYHFQKIIEDPDLQEVYIPEREGKLYSQFEHPFEIPEESKKELEERAERICEKILRENTSVLVITHGCTAKELEEALFKRGLLSQHLDSFLSPGQMDVICLNDKSVTRVSLETVLSESSFPTQRFSLKDKMKKIYHNYSHRLKAQRIFQCFFSKCRTAENG